jgi:hypothetical protein
MKEKNFMTTDDTEIFCGLCYIPTGFVVESGEFIGFVLCSYCVQRAFISRHEVQHTMHKMFEVFRMGLKGLL